MRHRQNNPHFSQCEIAAALEKLNIDVKKAVLKRFPNNPQQFTEEQLDQIEKMLEYIFCQLKKFKILIKHNLFPKIHSVGFALADQSEKITLTISILYLTDLKYFIRF